MIKKIIRDILIQRQHRLYRNRIRCKHIYYHDWENDWEKINPKQNGQKRIRAIRYDQISALLEKIVKQETNSTDILIFMGNCGKLTRHADAYVEKYFDEHPDTVLLYGDEDCIDSEGKVSNPYFKPDWSPDSYLDAFYVGNIFAVRTQAFVDFLKKNKCNFISDVCSGDILFGKLAEFAGGYARRDGLHFPIGHVDEILFHNTSGESLFYGREFSESMHQLSEKALISMIIPSMDHPAILKQCIESVILHESGDTAHVSYEIIVVDNGSSAENKEKTEKILEHAKESSKCTAVKYLYQPMSFNFSKMCNMGAAAASGNYLLFLNDDIEVIQDGWLRELVFQASLPWAGAVGAKLLYPGTDLIQHVGITKVRLGPMHKLQKLHDEENHYFGMNQGIHDVIGVTGACLILSKERFTEAGGYPEELAVAFNDVDLCYTLFEMGYYNIVCNHVKLYHHESLSRGDDTADTQKLARLGKEYETLMSRHKMLDGIDPFYHKYLTDDEHIADFLRMEEADRQVQKLSYATFKALSEGYPAEWTDQCLRIGVEYADTMERWIHNYRLTEDGLADGYFIKGYCFVIGSDNALYHKKLLLRPADGTSENPVPQGSMVYEAEVYECYREDIRENLAGQVNVDLTGFRLRIRADQFEPGKYQVGMLFADQTSRQRIINWAPNLLLIAKER